VVWEAVRNSTPQRIPKRIVGTTRTTTCWPIRESTRPVTGGATCSAILTMTCRITRDTAP